MHGQHHLPVRAGGSSGNRNARPRPAIPSHIPGRGLAWLRGLDATTRALAAASCFLLATTAALLLAALGRCSPSPEERGPAPEPVPPAAAARPSPGGFRALSLERLAAFRDYLASLGEPAPLGRLMADRHGVERFIMTGSAGELARLDAWELALVRAQARQDEGSAASMAPARPLPRARADSADGAGTSAAVGPALPLAAPSLTRDEVPRHAGSPAFSGGAAPAPLAGRPAPGATVRPAGRGLASGDDIDSTRQAAMTRLATLGGQLDTALAALAARRASQETAPGEARDAAQPASAATAGREHAARGKAPVPQASSAVQAVPLPQSGDTGGASSGADVVPHAAATMPDAPGPLVPSPELGKAAPAAAVPEAHAREDADAQVHPISLRLDPLQADGTARAFTGEPSARTAGPVIRLARFTRVPDAERAAVLEALEARPAIARASVDSLLAEAPGVRLTGTPASAREALLVFVQPGCPPCQAIQALFEEHHDRLRFPVLFLPVGRRGADFYQRAPAITPRARATLTAWSDAAGAFLARALPTVRGTPAYVWVCDASARGGTLDARELTVLVDLLAERATSRAARAAPRAQPAGSAQPGSEDAAREPR